MFWAWSVAWTSNVWAPLASGVDGVWLSPGPEHGAKGSESKRHSKVEPGSVAEKVKVGVSSAVTPVGPESICVSGGVESSS